MLDGEARTVADSSRTSFFSNAKGGVGKSFCVNVFTQHARHQGRQVICYDADAATPTLTGFAALGAKRLELMEEGSILNSKRLDEFSNAALSANCDVVLDTGTSTYIAFMQYAFENDLWEVIHAAGKRVIVHVIVVGGDTMLATLADLRKLAMELPPFVSLVVWHNEFFGKIQYEGKTFEQMNVYLECKHRIQGIIYLPALNKQTQGEDIRKMMERKLTFAEALNSPLFDTMERHRLSKIRNSIYASIDTVLNNLDAVSAA